MADQSIVAGARTAKALGITAVLVERIGSTALLRDVLLHFLEGARHDCGRM